MDETVAKQIDILGLLTLPDSWRKQWEQLDVDQSDNDTEIPRYLTRVRETWPSLEDAFEEFVQKYRRKRPETGIFDERETQAFLEPMRAMLKFRPEERLTIDEVLKSDWMVKLALPQLA